MYDALEAFVNTIHWLDIFTYYRNAQRNFEDLVAL